MTVQMSRRRAQDASLSDATGASPYRLARPADPLLRLDKISRHFGKLRAVNEVSFEMASGELRAVIGPNGAGKTTFFNLISGLHAPTSGRVWFAGRDVTSVPIVKRVALGIVRTFQITEIFPELSVFENIRLGVETAAKVNAKPWVSRKTRAALDRRLNELIEIVDLADKRENLVGELAHGDQRGRKIGFPTANLNYAREKVIPASGIYACWAFVRGRKYAAAVNIGTNPTFTPDKQTLNVEAYLLDFAEDIYDEVVTLEFVQRLRDELKYDSVTALIEQIGRDVEQTREILGTA